MLTKRMLPGVAAVFLAWSFSSAAEFQYEGQPGLILEVGAPDQLATAEFAGAELTHYFSRILGRELAWTNVSKEWPDRAYRIRLRTGNQTLKDSLVPTAARFGVDGFQVLASTNCVTITADNSAGLLYAVYDVLARQGCSWLFPGPEGESIPARTKIVVPEESESHADFSMRGLAPVENLQRYTDTDVRETMAWMARNRLNYFVAIVNYGWDRLGKTILNESRKRGIHVVGYLWSFELFLPLETGQTHPEYFAFFEGKRQVDYNVKRCASAPAAIDRFVENGCRWFAEHPEIEEWIVIPNDGFHWCQCEKCLRLKPKDQWAAFFTPLAAKLAKVNPRLRLQNFIYVTRYALPDNIAPYRAEGMDHFFDVHQRNKWFPLGQTGRLVEPGNREGEVDERARSESLNNYLSHRLLEWRAAVPGRIWIFENLMLHGTYSIPVPNLRELGADLRAAQSANAQGYLFESYLQGWNSFASDLWCLAQLCWQAHGSPTTLEKDYFQRLLGAESKKIEVFYDEFRAQQLHSVQRCGSLYWMHCVPESASRYVAMVRSLDPALLNQAGRAWLQRQLQVAAIMEEMVEAGAHSPRSVFGDATPAAVLKICDEALQTGRAMDGVFLAYEQLRQLFLREFPKDPLGFRPLLPKSFEPQVQELFSHQKLWDTLAEWEVAGRFPQDPSDPDRSLRDLLQRAIQNYRTRQDQ